MTDIRAIADAAAVADHDEHCSGMTIVPIRKLQEWADEIERLQAENKKLEAEVDRLQEVLEEYREC